MSDAILEEDSGKMKVKELRVAEIRKTYFFAVDEAHKVVFWPNPDSDPNSNPNPDLLQALKRQRDRKTETAFDRSRFSEEGI